MPVNTRELIDALSIIADNHNIRVTVVSSLKSSCLVAGTTFAGGLLLGPPGLAIGATVGGICAYQKTKGTFKSAAVIIRDELTREQQERLCDHIIKAFKEVRPEEIIMLIPLLLQPGQFQTLAVSQIGNFLRDELNMRVSN